MPEKKARPKGRPSKYKPEFCQVMIDEMKEGAAIEEVALELDIHKDTLYEWCKVYPDFSDAKKKGVALSEGWWMREGRKNLHSGTFSATLWYMNMKNRHKWCDRNESKQEIKHSFDDLTDEQLEAQLALMKQNE